MSDAVFLRWIALGMFLGALLYAGMFVTSGFVVAWMVLTAAFLVGSFVAVVISFTV